MANGLVRRPARIITPLESFLIRTFMYEPDDNDGNLRHAELSVAEARMYGVFMSDTWSFIDDHQRIRAGVRRRYRRVMAHRSPHGPETDLGAVAAELGRLAAAVDALFGIGAPGVVVGEAALLWSAARHGGARLAARLAAQSGPELEVDVSWVASVLDSMVPALSAEQRDEVAWAAVENVYQRVTGRTRARVVAVNAVGWSWSTERVERVRRWFPQAEVRVDAAVLELFVAELVRVEGGVGVLVPVRWVQESDKYRGAHSAPERVNIAGLGQRLGELAAGVGGEAGLVDRVVGAGVSGEEGVQVVRDAAYLAAAVFGAGFGLADLVAVGGLMAVPDGPAVVDWDDLEALAGVVRGDGGPVSVGEVRLVVEAARLLGRGEVTVAGLRGRVGSVLARLAELATAAGGADALADRVGARRGVGSRYGIGVVFGDAVALAWAVYGDGFTERDLINAGRLVMAGLRSGRGRGFADLDAVVRGLHPAALGPVPG